MQRLPFGQLRFRVLDDTIDDDGETVILTLSNARAPTRITDDTAIGTIENSDPMPKAWLVRFGRTVASQVIDALSERFDGSGRSHVTVGGIEIRNSTIAEYEANARRSSMTLARWDLEAEDDEPERTMTLEDLAKGTRFHLSSGTHEGGGTAYTAWGRVATGGFEAEVDDVTLDGDVTSALVGFDAEWDRALAGVMLSQSSGEGGYRLNAALGDDAGTVKSSLTGVYPYARLTLNPKLSAWAPEPRPRRQHPSRIMPMEKGTLARCAAGTLGTVAMMVATSGGAAPPPTDGPFNMLEWADGVTTSRSGYAVWISMPSTHHEVEMPGYARAVGPPEHRAGLGVSCRAPGGALPERFPPTGPQGGIYLDNHPEDPGVYTVLHPMYWILMLSEDVEERWPVQVRIGAGATMTSNLVRARIDYSAPRPGLDIALPGSAILEAILAEGPIEVAVQGDTMQLTAHFTASANARRAAVLMRNACAKAPD